MHFFLLEILLNCPCLAAAEQALKVTASLGGAGGF